MSPIRFWEQFIQDVRYAFRTMTARPLFTVMAALSLALGIGANTAIYSFMDSILLRALPVTDPESLVVLNWHAKPRNVDDGNGGARRDFVMKAMSGSSWGDAKSGTTSGMFPFEAFELLQKDDAIFSSVFAYFQPRQARKVNLEIKGQADVASGLTVSGEFFRGLGVFPAAGRL